MPCPRRATAAATTVSSTARAWTDSEATSASAGGAGVAKPRVAYQSTSRSFARHDATIRLVPVTRAVTTRRTVGAPGGRIGAAAVGVRRPPPVAGMQPMWGRKVGGRAALPV